MFYGSSSYISTSMILDDGQMLMVTEEQDQWNLENGKRYQKMSRSRPPQKHAHFTSIQIMAYALFS